MKTTTLLMMGAGFVLTSVSGWAEPTTASELERGVELMKTETSVGKAIPHFEEVIRRDKKSSRLAAEAWYQLAKCHLALGDKGAALRCVARLGEGWPADNEWVIRAGELPLRPGVFREAPWASGELLTYGMKVDHEGEIIDAGRFASLLVASEEWGESTWTAWSFGQFDISTFEFKRNDYRPVGGRFHLMLHGDQTLATSFGGGQTLLRRKGIDRPIATFPLGGNGVDAGPVYHFMQVPDLVRVLKLFPGTSITLPVMSPKNPAEKVTYTITATEPAKIETPAGEFDCMGYGITWEENPEGETHWVEIEGQRKVVKVEMGPMTAMLLSAQNDWKADESFQFSQTGKPGDLRFTVPRGLVALEVPDSAGPHAVEGAERVRLYDTRLRVWTGMVERVPVPVGEREAMREEGFSPDAVQGMLESLQIAGSVVEEIEGARKLSNAGGGFSLTTRFRIERGEQKLECTALLSLGKDSVIFAHFEHEQGADEAAVKLLEKIRRSL